MQTKKVSQQGFTLMELMVVMTLMAILVAMGLSSFRSSQIKSADSKKKSNLRQISLALEAYYNDKGRYPADDNAGNMMGCSTNDALLCAWGGKLIDSSGTIYMVELPDDTSPVYNYYYDACCSNKGYQLYARLENLQDGSVSYNSSTSKYQSYTGTTCGSGKKCNYGIASTNQLVTDNGHTLVDE